MGSTRGKQGLVARMAGQAVDFVKSKYDQSQRRGKGTKYGLLHR